MKLGDYLKQTDLSPGEFAEKIGVTGEAVRLYVKGVRRPRNAVLTRIVSETAGVVTANDFYGAEARAS